MHEGLGSRMICFEWLRCSCEISEIDRKIIDNVKSKILPEGPAKERNRRRVLRTMCEELFIMRKCAVKHVNSITISSEISIFHEISEFPKNLRFSWKSLISQILAVWVQAFEFICAFKWERRIKVWCMKDLEAEWYALNDSDAHVKSPKLTGKS